MIELLRLLLHERVHFPAAVDAGPACLARLRKRARQRGGEVGAGATPAVRNSPLLDKPGPLACGSKGA